MSFHFNGCENLPIKISHFEKNLTIYKVSEFNKHLGPHQNPRTSEVGVKKLTSHQ